MAENQQYGSAVPSDLTGIIQFVRARWRRKLAVRGTLRVIATAVALFGEGHPRLATFRAKGSLLVGDVHPEVASVAGALTPVPGGVGLMTICGLLTNTFKAAKKEIYR